MTPPRLSRWPRLAALAFLLLALPVLARDSLNLDSRVTLTPLAEAGPLPRVLGQGLVLTGAWELTSPHSFFGGFSGLMSMGERGVLAISDGGWLLDLRLPDKGSGIAQSRIFPLPTPGGAWPDKRGDDAEALVRDPLTGRYWVSVEQRHALRRYAPDFAQLERVVREAPMRRWRRNGGAEALTILPDGRFLAIAERAPRGRQQRELLLWSGEPGAKRTRLHRSHYESPAGYAATDAAPLGRRCLLVLHRRFSAIDGVSAKLGLVAAASLGRADPVRSRVLLTLAPPFPVDNMEGLAVERRSGKTTLWMISDDNTNPVQRTILLRFDASALARQCV